MKHFHSVSAGILHLNTAFIGSQCFGFDLCRTSSQSRRDSSGTFFFVFKECKNGHKTQTAKFYGFFLLKNTKHLECQRSVCVWPWLKWVYTVLILFNIEMNHKLRKIWWFGAKKNGRMWRKATNSFEVNWFHF